VKILAYISFAVEVAAAVGQIIALVATKVPFTGPAIQSIILPAITEAQTAFGFAVPAALVTDICDVIAVAVNKFEPKT